VKQPEITYEPLSFKNLPDVLAIERASFSEPWSERLFVQEMTQPESYFVVFRLDSRMIGYGGFWLVLDEAHITNIAVDPLCRRQGFGTLILQHLCDIAVSRHATMATLEVRQNNAVAMNLYKKFGFRPVAIRKGYYSDTGEDAIVMVNDDLQASLNQLV
jgi:ribosomal-protein-alanine N-acetyltransferase